MSIIPSTVYSNISLYPSTWYQTSNNWAAKTVSGATDRYKLVSPTAMQVDVDGLSLTSALAQELDLSLDATWDFGQSTVGIWTAGHSYSVGDWVRPATAGGDGANNVNTSYATLPMSANTSLGQVVSASHEYSATYAAYKAFDGSPGVTAWDSSTAGDRYITLDFGSGNNKIINKFRYVGACANPTFSPKRWKFQGSLNGSTWVDLKDMSGEDVAAPARYLWTPYFTFTNSIAYQYYRFYITDSYFSGWSEVGDLHLVEARPLLYKCTTAGISLSTEPTWGTTISGTTVESGGPTWTCYYDDTVASNRAGQDFFIYACQPSSGSVPRLVASRNSTVPNGTWTSANSRKIGGFHCLCASVGTIAGHPLSGYLTGDILPTSVWDLKKRANNTSNNNNGLAYINELDSWAFIYLPSGSATAPVSAYGGTILVAIDWNNTIDAGRIVGMRLLRDHEFQVFAILSNEQTNIYGSSSPTTTGGHVDTASRRMISKYGIEDCCGVLWQWLDEQTFNFSGATAHTHTVATVTGSSETLTSGNASADVSPAWSWQVPSGSKGRIYQQGPNGYGDSKMLAGGVYSGGAAFGSRSRYFDYNWRSAAYATRSFRLICPNQSK